MARFGVRLTARGWSLSGAALAAFVVAYATGWPAMVAVGGFLLGVVVVGAALVRLLPFRVTAERRVAPTVTMPGRAVAVHLVLGGDAAASAEWSDGVPRDARVIGAASGVLGRGSAAAELDYEVVPQHRGLLPIGPLRLERTDPFGVAVAARPSLPPTDLVVLPVLHEVVPPATLARSDADPSAAMVIGAGGDQRDIIARPYQSGDPMRQVDWRQTAHRGELMVRSEASAQSQGIAIVFDLRESSWWGTEAFEWALELAASLLDAAVRARVPARLVLGADSAFEDDGALIALATAERRRGAAVPLDVLVRLARAATGVQVVHVVTGAGGGKDVGGLAPLPHGLAGLASVVGGEARGEGRSAWRTSVLDPGRPVSEAWARG